MDASVRHLTGPGGQLLGDIRYSPFGEIVDTSGAISPLGFTGEMQDELTGLIYLRARYYRPEMGRLLTRDSFPGFLHQPATQHPYMYGFNDPLLYGDASGKHPGILIGGTVGGIIGAGSYFMNASASGSEINYRDLAAVTTVGVMSGAMIGSGAGMVAHIGAGAGFSGLGYMIGNSLTGTEFCLTAFLIASGVGAGAASFMPLVGTSTVGAVAVGGGANILQYSLTEAAYGRPITTSGIVVSAILGGISGGIGGNFTAPRQVTSLDHRFLIQRPGVPIDPGIEGLQRAINRNLARTFIKQTPRSTTATLVSNFPLSTSAENSTQSCERLCK